MTSHVVTLGTAEPIPLAAVRREVPRSAVYDAVIGAPIWGLAEARGIPLLMRTVVIFHGSRYPADDTIVTLDVGLAVAEPFESDLQLQSIATPSGRTAEATLVGDYERLPEVHHAIAQWCAAHGHVPTGVNWEIVTWHEEPEKRFTKVYYLLE
ncbi:GyrI-like domain-containing protein [Devosia sp.]|uniref:GyrI-like domain-containing protein n=1 Tax=Devosia sp. TaxID=1871048 RepID=UPI003BA8CC35